MALQQIASPVVQGTYVRPAKLNVYILDVSGSMGWACQQLAEDTALRIEQLPLGDAVLIGIFSSPGWYRWIAARVLDAPAEYQQVQAIIRREVYARNTTCFSDIMADVPKAIKPFLPGYQVVTLTFMSDGCAVVPSLEREYAALDTAALALKPYLTAGSVIAYGDYADRKTLSKLAGMLGIEFLSTDHVSLIGDTFTKHAQGTTRTRRKVKVPSATKLTFAKEADGTVTALEATDGEVTTSDTATVYSIADNGPAQPWVEKTPENAHDVLYASALAFVRQGKVDDALELLSALGDIALVRMLSNALTNAELSEAEAQLQAAIVDGAFRFTDGREPGCLPKEDAFDLLDLLTLLMDDPECQFFPRHTAFRYKRIGRATKTVDGYPVFTPFDVGVPMATLVGNATELNLSVLVTLPGSLALPETTLGGVSRPETLPEIFPTKVFRTYSLIANAMPVVTQLPVKVSAATYKVLCREGVIRHRQKYDPDRIEVLVLNRVPVCNKARGKAATDWDRMASLSLASLRLGAYIKVLKAKAADLDPAKDGKRPLIYTEDEDAFLAACGMRRDGSYAPPVTQEDATDVLTVRVLEVKPEHSSPVSMKDFQLMLDGKKKWNYVGALMKEGLELASKALSKTKATALAWLYQEIADLQEQKRHLDTELHTRRFAIALTGGWARSFTTESVTNDSAGHPVTLKFRTIDKKI